MNELDEAWSQMLAGAIADAKSSGRADVAEYLALKRSNDAIRQTSVDWLFNSFIAIASDANRAHPSITIEREEPHEFEFNHATMAGSLIRIRFGVRCLTVEAGWPRTPSHGFMRGGSLAAARISHFGLPRSDVDLSLERRDEVPAWTSISRRAFDTQNLREHVDILLKN